MKKIAFDMDGVLVNFMKGFSELGKRMNPELPIVNDEDTKAWNLESWYGNKEIVSDIWNYMRKEDIFFWTKLEPLVSKEEITRIKYNGHEIYVITSRNNVGYISAQKQTVAWVKEIFDCAHPPQVIICTNKAKICELLNIDYYIDDKPDNLVDFYREPFVPTQAYLLYKPYMKERTIEWQLDNKKDSINKRPFYLNIEPAVVIPVVYSLSEFLDIAGL